jgi:hypothetical protein
MIGFGDGPLEVYLFLAPASACLTFVDFYEFPNHYQKSCRRCQKHYQRGYLQSPKSLKERLDLWLLQRQAD